LGWGREERWEWMYINLYFEKKEDHRKGGGGGKNGWREKKKTSDLKT